MVEPIIRTASVYTVTAKTGAGKTALAVVLCLAVATGRQDILNLEVERGRVAYLAFENPDDVRMRLKIAAYLLNVDLPAIGLDYIVLDARLRPEDLIVDLRKAAAGGVFSLVILDTFAAGFDGDDINNNVQAGEYVRRLRPVTQIAGLPALVIPAHPVKNAAEDNLVPYGGGAILNEVDGNLTLAKRAEGGTTLHWQGKFRGLEFKPRHFRFEIVSSPDLVDKKGRQVALPVLRPRSDDEAEAQAKSSADRSITILKAISGMTKATQRDIAVVTGISKSSVDRGLQKLQAMKFIEADLRGALRITPLGRKKLGEVDD